MTLGRLSKGILVFAVIAAVIVAGLGAGVATGTVGTPTVTAVENEWGTVTNESTEIVTRVHVDNPNPVAIPAGGLNVRYTVWMNDVAMANGSNGSNAGLRIEPGSNTLVFETRLDNADIPRWWVTHVNNGGESTIRIEPTVAVDLGVTSLNVSAPTQQRTIRPDMVSALESKTEQEVRYQGQPVLIFEEVDAGWGEASLERTPLHVDATVRNPNPVPVAFTRVGYEMTMNNVSVASGETETTLVVPPGGTDHLETTVGIDTRSLDQWWVRHVRNGERTNFTLSFYAVVEVGGERMRVPLGPFTVTDTFETDML